MKLILIGLALMVAAAACGPPALTPAQRPDPSRITREEIVASHATDAYDAITKLRANFLASRGPTNLRSADSAEPTVFLDGIEYGPISLLGQIPASSIWEIRLLRSWEATTIYGTGYMAGVIAITTRR